MLCQNCSFKAEPGDKYCQKCGSQLELSNTGDTSTSQGKLSETAFPTSQQPDSLPPAEQKSYEFAKDVQARSNALPLAIFFGMVTIAIGCYLGLKGLSNQERKKGRVMQPVSKIVKTQKAQKKKNKQAVVKQAEIITVKKNEIIREISNVLEEMDEIAQVAINKSFRRMDFKEIADNALRIKDITQEIAEKLPALQVHEKEIILIKRSLTDIEFQAYELKESAGKESHDRAHHHHDELKESLLKLMHQFELLGIKPNVDTTKEKSR